jgi:hypothetical protein
VIGNIAYFRIYASDNVVKFWCKRDGRAYPDLVPGLAELCRQRVDTLPPGGVSLAFHRVAMEVFKFKYSVFSWQGRWFKHPALADDGKSIMKEFYPVNGKILSSSLPPKKQGARSRKENGNGRDNLSLVTIVFGSDDPIV